MEQCHGGGSCHPGRPRESLIPAENAANPMFDLKSSMGFFIK
jgi:hypothetical protein